MVDKEPSKSWQSDDSGRPRKPLGKQIRRIEKVGLKHAHTFIVRRWENVQEVRRHALAWLLLVGVLIGTLVAQTSLTQGLYRTEAPKSGGTYAEGVLGNIDTLNPVLASTPAEQAVSRLVFRGLLRYDADGKLLPDMAARVTKSKDDRVYTADLKPRIRWHDGAPLTSEDVVFTINTIKNATINSPFYAAWREVSVSAKDENTITFKLPAPFAPFPHLLAQAIIPAHAFEGITAVEFRNSRASLQPIGTGAFGFRSMQTLDLEAGRKTVHLTANPNYYGGNVELERFQIHTYPTREDLRRGMATGEVNAAAGLTTQEVKQLSEEREIKVKDLPLNSVALAIFNTSSGVTRDKAVRAALRLATDRKAVIQTLDNRVLPLELPIPATMIDGLEDLKQPAFNLKSAASVLQKAGWKLQKDGKRVKSKQELQLNVATLKTGDYPKVLEAMVSQWSKLGITIQTTLVEPDVAQQSLLEPRAYDVLVYEMEIEGDPDVYPYWHSSSATSSGLNLANYKSDISDDALTSGRSVTDPKLRAVKYRAFAQQWLSDIPAVALYRPTLHYAMNQSVNLPPMNNLSDQLGRYGTVIGWTVAEQSQFITP